MTKKRVTRPRGAKGGARKKSTMSRGSALKLALLGVSALVLVVALFFFYAAPALFDSSAPVDTVQGERFTTGADESARQAVGTDVPVIRDTFKGAPSARIAIVIDDIGYDIKRLRRLFALDAELAVAVLPHLRYSRSSAQEAHSRGWQVLLHMPMEPENSRVNDPGSGALRTSMSTADLLGAIDANLGSVPHVAGVNNHMGSKATADRHLMTTVLGAMDRRDLFFLDSRTTPKSVASALMKELGIRGGVRNVFLDNTRDRDYIRAQLGELVRLARLNGSAIAIGHPYTETIDVLLESVPGLISSGIEVVRLSELMKVRQ